ncbi:hypothetical protein BCR43DRAFT_521676 [Syncephalastrum racemosum]|uniref:F-box domain-containing protein n=1 Tax=Syncephalastrum racemosum TaxID=13706 RepID=A0A1X2HMV7_SYNRA|nr:hypothetical protein BCR43DRAFT_521676 [Syncephalastrum racemosum]
MTDALTDDCLQVIFSYLVCPVAIRTAASVCRRWSRVASERTVWRRLVFDQRSLFEKYTRFLNSSAMRRWCQAVQDLAIVKWHEKRQHVHFHVLPIRVLSNLRRLETVNLCLHELAQLLDQVQLEGLVCRRIEPWCMVRYLEWRLFASQTRLRHLELFVKDNGYNGFGSVYKGAEEDEGLEAWTAQLEVFSAVNIRVVPSNRNELTRTKYPLEHEIVLPSLTRVRRLQFGFCFWWSARTWRERFLPLCQHGQLVHLTLHGWFHGGTEESKQPHEIEAEHAMASCFAALQGLQTLTLVDFLLCDGVRLGVRDMLPRVFTLRYSAEFGNSGFAASSNPRLLLGEPFEALVDTLAQVKVPLDLRFHPSWFEDPESLDGFHTYLDHMIPKSFRSLFNFVVQDDDRSSAFTE